jgi:hypothetical protein
MIDEYQTTARPEDALHLRDGPGDVGHTAQRVRADNGMERTLGERKVMSVPFHEGDPESDLVRPRLGDGQHLGAEVESGEANVVGVMRQVQSGADGNLERVAPGLGARPATVLGPQKPSLEEIRLAPVLRSLLGVDPALDLVRASPLSRSQ